MAAADHPLVLAGRLAVDVKGACRLLNISHESWKAYVESEVRIVRLGRRKVIAVSELQRFLDDRGEYVLPGPGMHPQGNPPGAGARARRAPRTNHATTNGRKAT